MMRLPRALDNADYANHVSPMVPARGGGSISPTVNQARRRIDSLAQQRAQNHQTLTSGVSKRQKSKTVKQLLAENESLQRFNAMQHQRIKSMEAQAKANKSQYLLLAETHNRVLKELHKVQHESKNKNKE
ncbi:hypothetical protein N7535_003376 [Penicillium sp. DV-2018c]|nr:hypothetical protein N7535_003376 [Penicillium sp. DV-2018c]